MTECFLAHFAGREWDAMPQILGDNFSYDDRRRVVGSESEMVETPTSRTCGRAPTCGPQNVTPTVMATRGERLVLAHLRFPGRDQGPEAFVTDVLGIIEINADERMVAFVSFELDDFTRPSPSSTHGTSPAKRPPTHTHGRRLYEPTPRSTDTKSPTTRTGSTSTIGAAQRSRRAR